MRRPLSRSRGPLLSERGRQWVAIVLTALAALAMGLLCGVPPSATEAQAASDRVASDSPKDMPS